LWPISPRRQLPLAAEIHRLLVMVDVGIGDVRRRSREWKIGEFTGEKRRTLLAFRASRVLEKSMIGKIVNYLLASLG
jgi:hypothetical protein